MDRIVRHPGHWRLLCNCHWRNRPLDRVADRIDRRAFSFAVGEQRHTRLGWICHRPSVSCVNWPDPRSVDYQVAASTVYRYAMRPIHLSRDSTLYDRRDESRIRQQL